jgi:hypothetical protein
MRWIERWVEKRKGFPGGGGVRWHDRVGHFVPADDGDGWANP